MATKSAVVSSGTCEFCKAEFAKSKMTQHLKSCKERRAAINAQEKTSQETKTRLFHIIAEGKYNPQYWLHFEVAASQSLWSLDNFIKKMWIDDLDHLSGFNINGTSYSAEYPSEYFSFSSKNENTNEDEDEEDDEFSEEKIKEIIEEVIETYVDTFPEYLGVDSLYSDAGASAWIEEVRKPRSVDELVDFLKGELPRITKESRAALRDERGESRQEARKRYFIWNAQKHIAEELLDIFEDTSMGATLERVLKVGQKFSYVYDFGSSTYINLKIIAEREGIVIDQKKPVQLLAQNSPETFPCKACGKPATQVEMGYYTSSIEEDAFCEECAEEHIDEGRRMPIINSPRVGVL